MPKKRGVTFMNYCVHVTDLELAAWIQEEAKRQDRSCANFLHSLAVERWRAVKGKEQRDGERNDSQFSEAQTA